MIFDVYCDENRPDLLSSKKSLAQYMVIGSVWLQSKDRDTFKREIHQLRDENKIGGEFKWQKISPSRVEFYKTLTDWFWDKLGHVRFRCIAVDHNKVNLLDYHKNDQELGFYKFYYQMLHHWITDFNEYSIFCDFKTNRHKKRLHVLERCLVASNRSATVKNVQAIRSRESVLLQLADVLTGAASARLNDSIQQSDAKSEVLEHLEQRFGRRIQHTPKTEQKFNVFVIDWQGGR